DLCIIKAIDTEGKVISKKSRGVVSDHILITNLVNMYQPIIQYKMNDSIEYIDCKCGSKETAIRVRGRSDDDLYFIDKEGKLKKHGCLAIETIFITIPYDFSYQV